MTKFIPLIDTNNKTVLQWTKVSNGVETVVSIPKGSWKPQNEWSESEIEALFEDDSNEQAVVEPNIDEAEEYIDEDLEEPIEVMQETVEPEKKSF